MPQTGTKKETSRATSGKLRHLCDQDSGSRTKYMIMELGSLLPKRVSRQEEEPYLDQRRTRSCWNPSDISVFPDIWLQQPLGSSDDYLTASFQFHVVPLLSNFYLEPCVPSLTKSMPSEPPQSDSTVILIAANESHLLVPTPLYQHTQQWF